MAFLLLFSNEVRHYQRKLVEGALTFATTATICSGCQYTIRLPSTPRIIQIEKYQEHKFIANAFNSFQDKEFYKALQTLKLISSA